MTCFIAADMPASGKNIARSFARRNDIPCFATSDIARKEIEYGAAAPVALADEHILNVYAAEDALDRLQEIVVKYVHR